MPEQEQFLQVLDRDEAERRFRAALDLTPRGIERCRSTRRSAACWPPTSSPRSMFRRSIARTSMASPSSPKTRSARPRKPRASSASATKRFTPAWCRRTAIHAGEAVSIATGGMMPRGADAVVMVEHAEVRGGELRIARAVTAGSGVSFAGTDITAGETVLRRAAADQPRHRRAGRDRRRRGRRLAQADRRHPLDRRRDHRARRADAAGQGLRLERAGAGRRRPRAGGEPPRLGIVRTT